MKKALVLILCCFVPFKKTRIKIRQYFDVNKARISIRTIALAQQQIAQQQEFILNQILFPNSYSIIQLMMDRAGILEKHRFVFWEIKENDICLDCGANIGLISDIILRFGGICYAFEPNKQAINLFRHKYKSNNKLKFINAAVSNENKTAYFIDHNAFLAQAGRIVDENSNDHGYFVNVIRLVDFIENLLKEGKDIYILKLDVEGEEFDILEDMIESGVYKHIKYIFCETHERLSPQHQAKFLKLQETIKKNAITNIYLDWI
jgi:FkbM family methyltransferase